jgi:hypothetical protein
LEFPRTGLAALQSKEAQSLNFFFDSLTGRKLLLVETVLFRLIMSRGTILVSNELKIIILDKTNSLTCLNMIKDTNKII